jgi:uncharacterized protein YcaQ
MIMKAGDLTLSLDQARRLAVCSQHLAGPRPAAGLDGMRQVLRGLRVLQVDPVNIVARNQFLVLWSRLGEFDRAGVDTLLWREHWLFERLGPPGAGRRRNRAMVGPPRHGRPAR